MELFDALQGRVVDLILIDTFSLASYADIMKGKSLKIKQMEDTKTGYGLVLSGISTALKTDIEGFILTNAAVVTHYIASVTPLIPVRWFFTCFVNGLLLH